MRAALTISLFLFIFHSFGQTSDLYNKVDSIIKFDLKINIDSLKKLVDVPAKIYNADTAKVKFPICHATNTFGSIVRPLIVLNDKLVEMDSLNRFSIANVKSYYVLKGDQATALYGSRGVLGVVIIQTKSEMSNEKIIKINCKLLDETKEIFPCGIAMSSVVYKFQVISSSSKSVKDIISIKFTCPADIFPKDFFKKDRTYNFEIEKIKGRKLYGVVD